MYTLRMQRVYDPPSTDDGWRVLTDRLWPRGLTREHAALALWAKALAPTTALRQWFGHDPARFAAFAALYRAELEANPAAADFVRTCRLRLSEENITLLGAAKDMACSHTAVLCQWLSERLADPGSEEPAAQTPPAKSSN